MYPLLQGSVCMKWPGKEIVSRDAERDCTWPAASKRPLNSSIIQRNQRKMGICLNTGASFSKMRDPKLLASLLGLQGEALTRKEPL